MDTSVLIGLATCVLLTAIWKWLSRSRRSRLPPGPIGLPILGYLPFLSQKPWLDFERLSKKYGSVFSIRLGSIDAVILTDFESTKEAFSQDAFVGRPPESPFEQNKETLATEAFNGLPWLTHRKLSLQMLKDVGYGKSKMETLMLEEIADLLEHLEQKVNVPFCVSALLSSSMTNNIGSLVFGKRLKYDDPVSQMWTKTLNETSDAAGQDIWQIFFPWMRNLCKFLGLGGGDRMVKIQKKLRDYIMKEINEHEETLNPNDIRDFIDGYLIEIKKRKDDPTFCKPFLQDLVSAFFIAGSDPVRITTLWLLLTAAGYQDAQRRIQREIDDVIGRSHLPSSTHQNSMPYTQAFIMEVMRWKCMIPVNFMRYAITDGTIKGYVIPKHSQVMSNFWTIHHDPDYWGADTYEFHPERFLTEDGQAVKKWEHFMPLSIGKRACPGEPFAKVAVFLYLTSILQRFNLRLPDGDVPDFEGVLGIGLIPKIQNFVFTRRD